MLPIVIDRKGWKKIILRSIKNGLLSHSLPRGPSGYTPCPQKSGHRPIQ